MGTSASNESMSSALALLLVFVAISHAVFPRVPRGPQWSKSIPGGPAPSNTPTVTVGLYNGQKNLPNIRVCLGDVLIICNHASGRVYMLVGELPNFSSGILFPIDHGRRSGVKDTYKYWVRGDILGTHVYRDVRSGQNSTIEVMPPTAHNATFYQRGEHRNGIWATIKTLIY